MLSLPVIVTIAAVFFWFISNLISKRISTGLGSMVSSTITIAAGVIPMLIGTLATGTYSIPPIDLFLAIVAGVFAFIGSILAYRALFTEQLTNIVALQEVSPPILVIFGVLVLNESLTLFQTMSIIVIFLGTVLVITNEKWRINRKLIPALLSVISWTVYWIILTYSINGSGTFAPPVTISRAVGAALLIAFLLLNKKEALSNILKFKKTPKERKWLIVLIGLAVVAGLSDGFADLLFSFTVSIGAVAIAGAISALTPIIITVFSFFIYKDKLTPVQLAGFIIMVTGAVALSFL